MKKWLSLLIAVVLLCGSIMPAYAFDYDQVRNTIYQDFMQQKWADYQAGSAELIQERPDLAQYVIQTYEEYLSYYSVNRYVTYVADFREEDESLWIVGEHIFTRSNCMVVGDYVVDLRCSYTYAGDRQKIEDPCLLQYYADGKMIPFEQAYAEGLITEADIATLYANGGADRYIYLIGDVMENRKITAGDIMYLKSWLKNNVFDGRADEINEMIRDVDKNGVVDAGDIMALKNIIMTTA